MDYTIGSYKLNFSFKVLTLNKGNFRRVVLVIFGLLW